MTAAPSTPLCGRCVHTPSTTSARPRNSVRTCAENHVAQGLLVQLEQRRHFFDGEELVQLRLLLANRVQANRDPTPATSLTLMRTCVRARVRLHSQRARPRSALARIGSAARDGRARGRHKLLRVGRSSISARPVHRRARSMESVAAARRPVIDNVHGAPQPQDELGPGMLVPRLWSPDSCLDTRQTRFLSKAVSARAAGYTPGRKRGPEREGIGRNDAGRSPGKGPGFAPGPSRVRRLGESPSRFLEEASGEAANRSEVATNSSTSLAMCALTKSRAKKWYNSGGPRGGGTGEIPPRGPLWAGRSRATPGSRNFTRAYRVLRIF